MRIVWVVCHCRCACACSVETRCLPPAPLPPPAHWLQQQRDRSELTAGRTVGRGSGEGAQGQRSQRMSGAAGGVEATRSSGHPTEPAHQQTTAGPTESRVRQLTTSSRETTLDHRSSDEELRGVGPAGGPASTKRQRSGRDPLEIGCDHDSLVCGKPASASYTNGVPEC
jgi:hypothetical protein